MQIGEDFASLFNIIVRRYHEEIQLALSTSFSHHSPVDINAALSDSYKLQGY